MIIDDRTYEFLKYEIDKLELKFKAIDKLKVGDSIEIISGYHDFDYIQITKIRCHFGIIDGFSKSRNIIISGIDLLDCMSQAEINRLTKE